MDPMTESPPTSEELQEVAKERERIRQEVTARRLGALREIANLRKDQCHLAPEIAQAALKVEREPS